MRMSCMQSSYPYRGAKRIRVSRVPFCFLDKLKNKFETLYLLSFLTQIMRMKIQNIANFLISNGFLFWISNFVFHFSFSHAQTNKTKQKTINEIQYKFFAFISKRKNKIQQTLCDFFSVKTRQMITARRMRQAIRGAI